ncbi:polyadenylate-binding protein RBP45, partial [Tanacetum coccineum]
MFLRCTVYYRCMTDGLVCGLDDGGDGYGGSGGDGGGDDDGGSGGDGGSNGDSGMDIVSMASYQNTQGTQNYEDPNNTTVFVGGLDPNVTDNHLKQVFSQYGQLVHVKIPVGKRCGFVQFAERNVRAKPVQRRWILRIYIISVQPQVEQSQYNGAGYYRYGLGYETYGYAPVAQDPAMYYGGYHGYGGYPQVQQQPHPQPQPQQHQ